jgi:glycosyltransferase involved in cell wall biosynthesis
MRVIGFVEGAQRQSGGVGLTGVPMIHQSLAARGHEDLLVVAGNMIPSGTRFRVQAPDRAFATETRGQAGAFAIPSLSRWGFSFAMSRMAPEVRRCDFVCLHSLYSFPVLAGYVMARRHHKPYGLWPHGVLAPVQRRISRGRKRLYDAIVSRRIIEHASVLFFSAPGERDETRALGLTAPSVVIPHGIDLQPFSHLPERGRFRQAHLGGRSGHVVLYLGRLNEKKGLDVLIDAAEAIVAAVPDTMIAIVGGAHPPSFARQVADWVKRSPVHDHIVMPGLFDEAQKLEALADADVFALPSEAENFGFAMFEAMASRVPVVVSDTLNYATAVRDADAGLTPPRESRAFADAIVSLLQDPERRRRMGVNGARLADCIIARRRFPPELLPEYPA